MVVYQADENSGTFSTLRQAHHDQESPRYLQRGPPSVIDDITIDPELEIRLSSPSSSTSPSLDDLRSAWFLTSEAWEISPVNIFRLTPISITMIHDYLNKTKDWLKEWASTRSNPFIHAELYSKGMPDCVQDAFLALSTYLAKTDKTEALIHRIIEEKVDKLVTSQTNGGLPNGTIDEIGRVQSLLIYSMIRLFDGDIRQRHLAERHLPVLHEWTKQMLVHASIDTGNDALLICNALTNYTPELTSEPQIPCQVSPEQLLWHAWIISESVRRTWCISMLIQSGYELLKTGTGPCYGGLLVTTRRGVWQAETAFAWTKLCAERSVGFVHRNQTESLMTERRMDEVDLFTLALMELDFGPDRMERWQLSNES